MVALKPVTRRCTVRERSWKQERRGGIETEEPRPQSPIREEKQERRGGIETIAFFSDKPVYPSKQERRGGIETALSRGAKRDHKKEAGTPWWH